MPTGAYKRTKEHREKIGEAHKGKPSGMLGKKAWNRGTRGVCKANSGSFKRGRIPWNKGKKYKGCSHSREWTEKVRQSLIKRADRIGRKKYVRPKHNTHWKYREWRTRVFKRDDFTCWICEEKSGKIEAHHLKKWSKYPNLRYKISNGLTLCEFCHKTYTKFQ